MNRLYLKLMQHVGHEIECVVYGDGDNVAVECVDCGCVLLDADRQDEIEEVE